MPFLSRVKFLPLSQEGNWLLVSCDERLPALCRRKSQIPINHSENLDTGCPEVRTQTHVLNRCSISRQVRKHSSCSASILNSRSHLTMQCYQELSNIKQIYGYLSQSSGNLSQNMTSIIWIEQDFGILSTTSIRDPELICWLGLLCTACTLDVSCRGCPRPQYSSCGQRLRLRCHDLCPCIIKTLFLHFDLILLHENWFVISDSISSD